MDSTVKVKNKKIGRKKTITDVKELIKDHYELAREYEKLLEGEKSKYQMVTSYLVDIQKIERIPLEDRGIIDDAARRIINLTRERLGFQNSTSKLNNNQLEVFDRYEKQIPIESPKILENEQLKEKIKTDLLHLEKNKRSLYRRKKEVEDKHSFQKVVGVTTSIVVIFLFIFFLSIGYSKGIQLQLPFLLTVIMAMIMAVYIFVAERKNRYDMKVIEINLNRNIVLANKVKIKDINNQSYLEYVYNKYMIKNHDQLKKTWEEYVRIKDASNRYHENTKFLELYNNELIKNLRRYGISDAEIWLQQPTAIVDEKEMVETRHKLNNRRQKIRELIDEYNKGKDKAIEEINRIIKSHPECEIEGKEALERLKH